MKQIISVEPKPGAVLNAEEADILGEHTFMEESMSHARAEFLDTYEGVNMERFHITMREQPTTNTEFLEQIMQHSRYGALMQCFIMERLLYASSLITENEEQVREQMSRSLVDADAWIGCAREFQDLYEKWMK